MGYKYLPDFKSETHVVVAYAKLGFKQESTCWEKWMKEESFSWENWKKSLQMPKVLTVGKTGSSAVAAGAARSSGCSNSSSWLTDMTPRLCTYLRWLKNFLGWASWVVKKFLKQAQAPMSDISLFPLPNPWMSMPNHRLVNLKWNVGTK